MVNSKAMRELRRHTFASSLDALQALSVSVEDMQRETDYLRTARIATKSLRVIGSEIAAHLAAELIHSRTWFECEQLDREKWHFAVAPAGYAHLTALHGELLCSRNA